MSTDRDGHTLTLLASGQILVAGGHSGGWGICNDLTSAELYDSNTGMWFLTGNMSAARIGHTATILPNGQVLAAGGTDCEGNILSSAELYTPPPVAALSTSSLTFGLQLVGTAARRQNRDPNEYRHHAVNHLQHYRERRFRREEQLRLKFTRRSELHDQGRLQS